MTQEDIVTSARTVKQGLETLKTENISILNGLRASLKAVQLDSRDNDPNLILEEKTRILESTIDSIELGLGEAEVSRSGREAIRTNIRVFNLNSGVFGKH